MFTRLFDRNSRRRSKTGGRRARGWHTATTSRRRIGLANAGISLEPLESRAMLANFTVTGTTLEIELDDNNDVLTLTATGTNSYLFTNSTNFKGADQIGKITGDGTKILTINTALGVTDVSIIDKKTVDAVTFGTSTGGSTYDANFSITLDKAGAANAVNVSDTTKFSNSHSLTVACHYVNVAASLSSATGGITLDADTGAQQTGIPAGVVVTAAGQVTTAGGSISLSGRGGDNAAGSQVGVALGGNVKAGDDGASTYGSLTITGIGGAVVGAGGSNHGVDVGTGVTVSSTGGAVSITGTGSSTNSGDHGVVIDGTVSTLTGGLAAQGDIEIIGSGGGGLLTNGNYGVLLTSTSAIQTVDGNVSITGYDGVGDPLLIPPFTQSPGIVIQNGKITSTTGDLSFTSANFAAVLSSGGAVSTTGIVAIRNLTAGQEIGFSKDNNNLLADVTASTIVIGRPDKLPVITQDPAPDGALTLKDNTNLTIYGSLISLKADITSKGGAQTYKGPVSLLDDVTLTGAGISFDDTLDGAKNLDVKGGAGAVALSGAVGTGTPLASLTISSAASVTAAGTIAIDGSAVGANTDGLVIAAGVNNVDMQKVGSVVKNATGAGILLSGGSTGSTLSGFTLSANGTGATAAAGAYTGSKFIGNDLSKNTSHGLSLVDATDLVVGGTGVAKNTFTDNKTSGIYASGTCTTTIIGNTISGGGTLSDGYYGVLLMAAKGLTLGTSTSGEGNGITGVAQGVYAGGDLTGTTVAGNTIESNVSGIVLSSATDLLVNGGNTLKSNSFFGLYALGTNTGTKFQGNTIDGKSTGYYGAYLDGAQALTVGGTVLGEENTITGTTQGVCGTGDLTGTTVSGNTIESNVTGIVLSSGTNLLVNGGNTLKSNSVFGLYALGTNTGTKFQGNTIDGKSTGSYGAYLDGAKDLTLGGTVLGEANTITGVAQGVFAGGDLTGTTVSGNTIESNVTGIVLSSSTNLLINGGNTLKSNSVFGLYALGTNTGTKFWGNTIDGNGTGYYGAYLDGAQDVAVGGTVAGRENTISGTKQAIYATGTLTNTTVKANTIQNNVSGLVLVGAQGITVNQANNVTSNTPGYGLFATGVSTGTTVTGNTISGNFINIETSTATGGTFQTS